MPSAAYLDFIEGFAETELEATDGYLEDSLLDALIVKIQAYDAEHRARGSTPA